MHGLKYIIAEESDRCLRLLFIGFSVKEPTVRTSTAARTQAMCSQIRI